MVVGGSETGDKKVKLIVHLLRRGRAKAQQMPRNLKAARGVSVSVHSVCSVDGGKWHVSEWSCDYSTMDCGRRSYSLHKLLVVIQHLDRYCNTASFSGKIPAF